MSNVLHCKISSDDQIRRFAFSGTEFTSFKRQIADLFSETDEFVLKYLDDENEYVILDSPEEFRTALLVSPGFLRLVIDKTLRPRPTPVSSPAPCVPVTSPLSTPLSYQPVTYPCVPVASPSSTPLSAPLDYPSVPLSYQPVSSPAPCVPVASPSSTPLSAPLDSPVSSPLQTGPFRRFGRGGHNRFDPQMVEMRRNHREMKLEKIKQKIASFGDDATLTPVQVMRKQRLLQKQERIAACENGQCPRKEWKQQTGKNLSPETVQHIILLKQQIQLIYPELKQLKWDIREFSRCPQMDDSIKQEIIRMKERKSVLKDQIMPLRIAIRSLKEGKSF